MTVATVINIPIMHRRIENTNHAIQRHLAYRNIQGKQEIFVILGLLLDVLAMMFIVIFERSTLCIRV